jgi:hypothetical protein
MFQPGLRMLVALLRTLDESQSGAPTGRETDDAQHEEHDRRWLGHIARAPAGEGFRAKILAPETVLGWPDDAGKIAVIR